MIVIPEEAEHLLSIVQESQTPASHIIMYAAPVTRKMLHFNHLQYYGVPTLPKDWVAPDWLRLELGLYSGRLYFEYSEYRALLDHLSVAPEDGMEDALGEDLDATVDNKAELLAEVVPDSRSVERPDAWSQRPLAFMQEWLAIRRKGQEFGQTPMGFICQGKTLLETHPFFASSVGRIDKIMPAQSAGVSSKQIPDEEEDMDVDDFDDQDYCNVQSNENDFDDAELDESEDDEEESSGSSGSSD